MEFIAKANSLITGQGTVSILTVAHDWNGPLVNVAPHFVDERRAVASRLVKELRSKQREWLGQVNPEDLQALKEAITLVLVKPVFGPLIQVQGAGPKPEAAFGAAGLDLDRKTPPQAINIGFEIECGDFELEGRHKTGPGDAVMRLLIKCMMEQHPQQRAQGFSVQSDGGHIELVSDPPRQPLDPVKTVAAMAKYVGDLHTRLLSLQKSTSIRSRAWRPARSVVPPSYDLHKVVLKDGSSSGLEVRFKASGLEGKEIPGMFHVTTGIHLSAIPWLFSSISGRLQDVPDFPLPGRGFLHDRVRKTVLDQLHELRKAAIAQPQRWLISPQFEGLAFLILTYVATAQHLVPQQHRVKVLSPKQLFLVLARTDFATMLKLCPEFTRLGTGSSSRRLLKAYRELLLSVMASGDTRLFISPFGRTVHPNQLAIADPSDLDVHELQMTPKQWLKELFKLSGPVDILTPQYQSKLANELPKDLFRGMGELGAKVDQIPGPESNTPVSAPIFELRQLTISNKDNSKWKAFAEHLVGVVSELNCPAYESDIKSAGEELEWLRLAGRLRVLNPGQNSSVVRPTKAEELTVDLKCAEYSHRMSEATMRADLWTLLDQARSHIEAQPRARKKN
ncbi:hypothetical protein [Granulosicoccus antarcticus]|uniref:hypothetical protein n=1 Tax=Granulosicoccus antarcticus TaxID=437505 RepID=UPI0012FDE9E5|nr:hypothetical protein [Granulosicoccus antarcticus]